MSHFRFAMPLLIALASIIAFELCLLLNSVLKFGELDDEMLVETVLNTAYETVKTIYEFTR